MKDIQVYTALDAKVKPAERLDILVLSTGGKATCGGRFRGQEGCGPGGSDV